MFLTLRIAIGQSVVYLKLSPQILTGTKFSVFVCQHLAGINFNDLYISFGYNDIIFT